MTRILANATVDELRAGSVPLWSVVVWGQPPHDHRRVYDIEAKSDSLAAQEGIARFVEEMTCLQDGADGFDRDSGSRATNGLDFDRDPPTIMRE